MDPIYVNKNGFKCVRSQLAKTDGRDPQEYEKLKDNKGAQAALKVKAAEYAE